MNDMRVVVLALVLCAGCAGTLPPLEDGTPQRYPAVPEIEMTMRIAKTAVLGTAALSDIVCDFDVASAQLCTSLKNSWKLVQLTLWESEKLYDVYRSTGVGLELVRSALDSIDVALSSLTQNAEVVKALKDAYRVPKPPGVPDGLGAQPPTATAPPGATANPYRQPISATLL